MHRITRELFDFVTTLVISVLLRGLALEPWNAGSRNGGGYGSSRNIPSRMATCFRKHRRVGATSVQPVEQSGSCRDRRYLALDIRKHLSMATAGVRQPGSTSRKRLG